MQQVLSLVNYGFILIFGMALSLEFAGVEKKSKDFGVRFLFSAVLIAMQLLSCQLLGLESTKKIYPLITHFTIVLLLVFYFRISFLKTLVSVLTAYLCCQIPRWIAVIVSAITGSSMAYDTSYMLVVFPVLWLLKRYVVRPTSKLMGISRRSLLLFGAVPLMYYVFDYATTIYTDLLYSGVDWAVQFMPSVLSVFYFVFALIYYCELQKRSNAEQTSALLSMQANQATKELDSYRESMEKAVMYRHDLRHHLALISGYLEEKMPEKAAEYICKVQNNIERITPCKYCQNTTVNLILSHFAEIARVHEVELTIRADLPQELELPETELCILLSNALENSISAAAQVGSGRCRIVRVVCTLHKGKMLIYMENDFSGEVAMEKGLPKSMREGHGFGVKSIAMIAEKYDGYCAFRTKDGIFTLKIVLPLLTLT